MRGCFVAKAHNRVRSIPNGKEAGLCRRQHDYKIKMQLAFIAMAIGALPARSCLPQYFGPKNTGEDCELADKKKNDNRVVHDLLLYRPAAVSTGVAIGVIVPVPRGAAAQNCSQSTIEQQGDTPLPAAVVKSKAWPPGVGQQ